MKPIAFNRDNFVFVACHRRRAIPAGTRLPVIFTALLLVFTSFLFQTAFSQSRLVRGKVTDRQSQPLPGVSILIKNTGEGTSTNENGEFQLETSRAQETLVFSSLGYQPQEYVLRGSGAVNIVLLDSAGSLNEVVVVGYGVQRKASLTGAVTSVKGTQLQDIPTAALSNTLAGRIPGATVVNNSGFVGANSSIQIRGLGTFSGNTQPLYVIDGVIQTKELFDALDAHEIESINVLKDAATASIYGSRAANGVILVQTKSGRKGKPVFSYSGTTSLQRPTRPIQSYSATEELQYRNDQAATFGNPLPSTPEMFEYFKDKSYSILDEIWIDPSSTQHDFSVNGGSETISYNMLLGMNKATGSFKNTDFSRYNFRSNVIANVNEYLKISLNLAGNQRESNRFYWPYDNAESFTVADFYRATFNWSRLYPFYVDEAGNPTSDSENGFPVTNGGWNPVELVKNGGYRNTVWRTLIGTGRIDFKIPFVPGLSTSFQYNYTASDKNNKNLILFNRTYQFQRGSTTNQYVPGPVDPTKMNVHNLSSSFEQVTESVVLDKSSQLDWYLNYDRQFGAHRVSGLLVYEEQKGKGKTFGGNAGDLLSGSVDQIFNASRDPLKRFFDGNEFQSARASWVGRAHYEYDEKYIAEASFRRDGSYIFPENSRWGFFPSGSAAWVISKENFFKVPIISYLKVRGSVGLVGNDLINPYQFQTNYVSGASYVFGNAIYNGIQAGTPPNLNITWEKSVSYNGGFDFALLDGRITGEFDYFYRKTYDILSSRIRQIPGTYGASLSAENYGKMDVRGFEVSLNYNKKFGEVNFSIGANMGYAKDKVLYIDEAQGLEPWRTQIGHPTNRIFGFVSEGIIRDEKALAAVPTGFTQFGTTPMLGVILYKDLRGLNWEEKSAPNGKVDDFDQTFISDNGIPRINYGINLHGDWRGLTVDALLQGVGAYDRVISTINGGGVFQTGDRPYFELWTERWTPENPNAKYPRAGEWSAPYGPATSTFWLRNGAYMRLRNLTVAYSLPKQWISPVRMQAARLFLNATNLFVISDIKEMDPEQASLDSYPVMKSITGGITITF